MATAKKKKVTKDTPKKVKKWRETFLAALRLSPNVSAAATAAGRSRKQVYRSRAQSPSFAAAWEDAIAQSVDNLEGEMYRRAYDGTTKPVYQGGMRVGEIQEYSDTLAIFMAKAHRPEKYREHIKLDVNTIDSAIEAELARVAGIGKTKDAGQAESNADSSGNVAGGGASPQ